MPTAYVYSRFSSVKQEQGHSLKRQRDLAQRWLEANATALNLVEDTSLNLTDSGLSGYAGTHRTKGALGVLERMIEDGAIDKGSYLLVESLDRLSRQEPTVALALLMNLINAGMIIVTLSDNKVYSKEVINADRGMSLIQSIIISGRAYEESEIKSQRVSAAWRGKMLKIADGVQLTKKVPFWILKEDKSQTIPDRVAVVQKIFQLAADGVGDGSIARTLNAEGVPTPTGRGQGWGHSSVMKVRKSRAALGELLTADGAIHKDYYPVVVAEEMYLKANAKNDLAIQPKTRDAANTHPLTGLCVCQQCGCSAVRSIKTGRVRKDGTRNRWFSLECSGAKKGTTHCIRHSMSYTKILDAVLSAIWDHDYVEDISSQLMNLDGAKDAARERLEIVKELQKKDRRNPVIEAEYQELLKLLGDIATEEARIEAIGNNAARNSAKQLKEQLFNQHKVSSSAVMGLVRKVRIDFDTETVTTEMRDGIVIEQRSENLEVL